MYLRIIDIIQEIDGWVGQTVFLHLKKALDKIPHNKLLKKIEILGRIQGKLLKWMKDFLRERQMRTTIREKNSSWKKVLSAQFWPQ